MALKMQSPTLGTRPTLSIAQISLQGNDDEVLKELKFYKNTPLGLLRMYVTEVLLLSGDLYFHETIIGTKSKDSLESLKFKSGTAVFKLRRYKVIQGQLQDLTLSIKGEECTLHSVPSSFQVDLLKFMIECEHEIPMQDQVLKFGGNKWIHDGNPSYIIIYDRREVRDLTVEVNTPSPTLNVKPKYEEIDSTASSISDRTSTSGYGTVKNSRFPGIVFHGSPIQESVTSAGATILPEDTGISVFIPEHSLSHGEEVDLLIHPCLSGSFELPPGYKLASPVYLIQPSRRLHLQRDKNATLKIHHYANLVNKEDCKEMVFLSASSTPQFKQSRPVYVFKEIKHAKGIFKPNCPVGQIESSHFCFTCICCNNCGSSNQSRVHPSSNEVNNYYSARLYWLSQKRTGVTAVFCICLYQPLYTKCCDKRIVEKYGTLDLSKTEFYHPVKITADEVTLKVTPPGGYMVQILKRDIDRPDVKELSEYPPQFPIIIDDDKDSLQLEIQGLEDYSVFLIPKSTSPQLAQPQTRPNIDKHTNGRSTEADTQLESSEKWKVSEYLQDIGEEELLELGQTLGLDRMHLKRSSGKELIGDLVTYWIRRDYRVMEESGPPTWRSLAKAMLKVNLTGKSMDIQSRYNFTL